MKCKTKKADIKSVPLSSLLSITHRQYINFLNKSLENDGINAGQVPFLPYLLKKGKACQDEMAEHYKIDKGSVARSMRKLEENGYITKKIDETNRRKYILSLTDSGEILTKKIIELDKTWTNTIYSIVDIPKEDIRKIFETVTITTININKKLCEKEEKNG